MPTLHVTFEKHTFAFVKSRFLTSKSVARRKIRKIIIKMHAVRDHMKNMCKQGYVQAGVCIQNLKSTPAPSIHQQDIFDLVFPVYQR